jgi:hypothetical protein
MLTLQILIFFQRGNIPSAIFSPRFFEKDFFISRDLFLLANYAH